MLHNIHNKPNLIHAIDTKSLSFMTILYISCAIDHISSTLGFMSSKPGSISSTLCYIYFIYSGLHLIHRYSVVFTSSTLGHTSYSRLRLIHARQHLINRHRLQIIHARIHFIHSKLHHINAIGYISSTLGYISSTLSYIT